MEEGKENGIRFKATIDSKANEEATEIGWIVVSYDKFMATNSSYNDLTVATENTKIGYQRFDGTDLVSFFDATDDEALSTLKL